MASGKKSVMYYKADHQLPDDEVQTIADWTVRCQMTAMASSGGLWYSLQVLV